MILNPHTDDLHLRRMTGMGVDEARAYLAEVERLDAPDAFTPLDLADSWEGLDRFLAPDGPNWVLAKRPQRLHGVTTYIFVRVISSHRPGQ